MLLLFSGKRPQNTIYNSKRVPTTYFILGVGTTLKKTGRFSKFKSDDRFYFRLSQTHEFDSACVNRLSSWILSSSDVVSQMFLYGVHCVTLAPNGQILYLLGFRVKKKWKSQVFSRIEGKPRFFKNILKKLTIFNPPSVLILLALQVLELHKIRVCSLNA